jgi:hypothetical protein
MNMLKRWALSPVLIAIAFGAAASLAVAQERLPWQSPSGNERYAQSPSGDSDRYDNQPPAQDRFEDGAGNPDSGAYDSRRDVYVPPPEDDGTYRSDDSFRADDGRRPPSSDYGYGEPYRQPPASGTQPYDRDYGGSPRDPGPRSGGGGYEQSEIVRAGHGFFGSISKGLASAVEYVFQKQGRPNGYILGEDAGGAFIVGLRYGEGILYTKDAGDHKVYWQGPSLGYDAGAEGSKTMVLVYNMRDVSEIYHRFGGVQGSLYVVGGVGVQFQKYGNVTLALIRSGVGLRMGANVGYLKYTRAPTWNPL